MTPQALSAVEIVPVKLVSGRVCADTDLSCWRDALGVGKIVIFRGAYRTEPMVALRRALLAWATETPAIPHGISASQPGLDFHRLDDGSAPTTLPHVFHQFGFATGDALPGGLAAEVRAMRHALLDWQNRLAGTDFDLDTPEFRFKAMRHPRGGGHLAPHRHPYLPQKVAIFLNLSEPGTDYCSGSARFRNTTGWVDTHADFLCGDLLAWRYDLVHGVTAVEPGTPAFWAGDDGLWIAAMESVDVHPLSVTA